MKANVYNIVLLATFCATSVTAKSPDNLDAIARETRIFANIFASALNNSPGIKVRSSDVQAAYLADQGVVLSFNLYAPWARGVYFNYNSGSIPELVHNVMADLQITVSPYEPQALEELRKLRIEQKSLRAQDRSLKGELRTMRRQLARKKSMGEEVGALHQEIASLEGEVRGLEAEYRSLAKDIDDEYKSLRNVGRQPQDTATPGFSLPQSVTQIVCDYGSTLKSLSASEHINISFRHERKTELLVFAVKNVKDCQKGSITIAQLLESAYEYQL